MGWPRLTALSEVVWTPAENKDYQDFESRLNTHLKRLDAVGVNYRPLDGPAWRYPQYLY
jgi:hexosaminidase